MLGARDSVLDQPVRDGPRQLSVLDTDRVLNDPSTISFRGRAMTSRQTARTCINAEFRIYTSYFRLSFAGLSCLTLLERLC